MTIRLLHRLKPGKIRKKNYNNKKYATNSNVILRVGARSPQLLIISMIIAFSVILPFILLRSALSESAFVQLFTHSVNHSYNTTIQAVI